MSGISIGNSPAIIICDDKSIMDNMLFFSDHIPSLLSYFSCISQVFTKYSILFKFSKFDSFRQSEEFIEHDFTTLSNYPTPSNFWLIEEWLLPIICTSLLSFISICTFYNYYYPWFEKNIKPLRKLQRSFHHVPFSFMALYPILITSFYKNKLNLIHSHFFLHYDIFKKFCLDWLIGSTYMGYILMQPGNSPEFLNVLKPLADIGECFF